MSEEPTEAVLWEARGEGVGLLKMAAGALVVGSVTTVAAAMSLSQTSVAVVVFALVTAAVTLVYAVGAAGAITEVELDGRLIRFRSMSGTRTRAVVQLHGVHLHHYVGDSPETRVRFDFGDASIEVSGPLNRKAEERLSRTLQVPVTSETTRRRHYESGGA
ncbi:hypothetical protein HS041_18585 [Planomonospora sp. ID67723]|uniref:hypothetical protein n=1 Tax=Planomonospora sp. ID67723 TaxID=2738134 RepID=UPI0018C3E705|nr:hypothetical protein [Planomonospora sp. ID67723]MBG0829775.1 hypothetical protein [Planomonospora sp. ID67723]